MALEIVVCISSHDSLVYNYVTPLALHPDVDKVWIVRTHRSAYGEIPKAEYVLARRRWMPLRLLNLFWLLWKLGGRPQVRAYASFNPFPYGMLAWLAARLRGRPVHLGFIGSDWQVHMKGPLAPVFLPMIRHADFVTFTGEVMRQEALDRGISAAQSATLPHGVDLSRFPLQGDGAPKRYDFFFAGELIPIKRVDVILRAFAQVRPRHPSARLGIAGRGYLDAELKRLAAELGIADQVDFLGFVSPVQPYYAQSRVVLIASESEGFPFTLVEGCSSGLVPVSTPVGTIPEYLVDGTNSLLTPVGDADALARAMISLLEDAALYDRLRDGAIRLRDRFSFASATRVWDTWIARLRRSNA